LRDGVFHVPITVTIVTDTGRSVFSRRPSALIRLESVESRRSRDIGTDGLNVRGVGIYSYTIPIRKPPQVVARFPSNGVRTW
jgi:hypothetical protein